MTRFPYPRLAALTMATCLSALGSAQAAMVLYEQAPLRQAGALANGSDGQAPLLAETFSFSGTASTLSWWGTPGEGFEVSLTAAGGSGPAFTFPVVHASAAGFDVQVDIDGDLQDDTVGVLRYFIDLGALPGGSYTLAIREVTTDALGLSWFWLHGAAGDGRSISGLGEPDQQDNRHDLSLRIDGERGGQLPEPASALLAATALAAWARRVAGRRPRPA